jgi:hypothetical protein
MMDGIRTFSMERMNGLYFSALYSTFRISNSALPKIQHSEFPIPHSAPWRLFSLGRFSKRVPIRLSSLIAQAGKGSKDSSGNDRRIERQ